MFFFFLFSSNGMFVSRFVCQWSVGQNFSKISKYISSVPGVPDQYSAQADLVLESHLLTASFMRIYVWQDIHSFYLISMSENMGFVADNRLDRRFSWSGHERGHHVRGATHAKCGQNR